MNGYIKYCPCGTGNRYLDCCGAYLQKKSNPSSPEALMRSRYTAYVEKNADYIRKTMKEPALKKYNKKNILKGREQWQGLQVIHASIDPNNTSVGYVEFIASFLLDNTLHQIHEKSEFHFIDNRWYYVDGV